MRGQPLTREQIKTLLIVYQRQGFRGAKPLALSYGVQPRYIARLARANGITYNYARGEPRVIMPKSSPTDPRWQWAIERGAVIA